MKTPPQFVVLRLTGGKLMLHCVPSGIFRLVLAGFTLAGCTRLVPTAGPVPADGREVAFDLTDAGRASLGQLIGPEVARAEGKVVSVGDSSYTLALSSLSTFRGVKNPWNGELVTFKFEHIRQAYVKEVDPGRTVILAGVAVGGFAAFVAGNSLSGDGGTNVEDPEPPDNDQRRGRHR